MIARSFAQEFGSRLVDSSLSRKVSVARSLDVSVTRSTVGRSPGGLVASSLGHSFILLVDQHVRRSLDCLIFRSCGNVVVLRLTCGLCRSVSEFFARFVARLLVNGLLTRLVDRCLGRSLACLLNQLVVRLNLGWDALLPDLLVVRSTWFARHGSLAWSLDLLVTWSLCRLLKGLLH